MFTIVASSATISWATAITTRAVHRRVDGRRGAAGLGGVVHGVSRCKRRKSLRFERGTPEEPDARETEESVSGFRLGCPHEHVDRRPGLRADARRNHEQLLAAAREVFVERGPGAPLDEVARRAGVGIATLYRRFPDRRGAAARRRARRPGAVPGVPPRRPRRGADGRARPGWPAYMHAVLDLRVSAVMPLALDRLDLDDPELGPAREASATAVERLVDAAHDDGTPARAR